MFLHSSRMSTSTDVILDEPVGGLLSGPDDVLLAFVVDFAGNPFLRCGRARLSAYMDPRRESPRTLRFSMSIELETEAPAVRDCEMGHVDRIGHLQNSSRCIKSSPRKH